MNSNWALIYTSNKPHEIAFASSLLEDAGIKTFTVDKKDSAYIFGDIELYVQEEEKVNALMILTQNDLL